MFFRNVTMMCLIIVSISTRITDLPAVPSSDKDAIKSLNELNKAMEILAERVSPAIVQIMTVRYAPVQSVAPTTSGLLAKQRGSGSGVILDPDGYIVTNAHVVDGAKRIQVMFVASEEEKQQRRSILKTKGKTVGAQIVRIDRETDLAVLKVQERDLPFLELGNSDDLRPGQIVLAFGSPFGLENSVTMGVVSAVARQLRPEDPMIYIQTDAPINPGNSGGPLVDTEGRVVGINTSILSQSGGSEGIGFAAPSNIVRNVFEQIRATGRVRRGEIGVNAQTLTPTLAAGLNLTRDWGVVLGDVKPQGPANRRGLKIADVILSLDGKPMENGRQFDVNLYNRAVGDTVVLEILRGSERLSLRVPVIERQDDPERFSDMVSPTRNLVPELGILGIDIDDRIKQMLPPLRKYNGVLVAAMVANAPMWNGGFLPGDVIYSVNGSAVTDLGELRSAVSNLNTYDPVVVQVERQGELQFIAFEIEGE